MFLISFKKSATPSRDDNNSFVDFSNHVVPNHHSIRLLLDLLTFCEFMTC